MTDGKDTGISGEDDTAPVASDDVHADVVRSRPTIDEDVEPFEFSFSALAAIDHVAFRMPSEEELNAGAEERMAVMRPFLVDNWPSEIRDISIPTIFVPFDKDLAVRLFEGGPPKAGQAAIDLARILDDFCGWDMKFFRLNSRSPKDSPFPLEKPITCSGKEMLGVIACSMRCMDDIATFARVDDPLYICLRDHVPGMDPDGELRCFVKNGQLLAVAQYGPTGIRFPDETRQVVDEWFERVLKPLLHVDTLVFDLWMGGPKPLLIELNPYGSSDPVGAGSYERIEKGIPGIAYRVEAHGQTTDAHS